MIRDLRYAARTLLRSPGFTLVVVATLALGIGANTAIFTVVNAVLLQDLPYERPEQLVGVWADVSARGGPEDEWMNFEDVEALAAEPGLFSSIATWGGWQPTLVGAGDAEVLTGATISRRMLGEVLGSEARLGRTFVAADDVPGAGGVVVLTHDAWVRRFASDPSIEGRTLTLSDLPYTVVGVMAPGFRLPFTPDAEIYRAMGVIGDPGCRRGCFGTRAIARLEEGVPLARAQERARDLGARVAAAAPDTNTGLTFSLVGLREQVTGGSAASLWVLLGGVGLVLLIACTNVANLLLVRGTARESEISVRVALGAGRAPILRQLLSESLLLAVAGGAAGLLVASWGTEALVALAPPSAVPRAEEVALDARVLGFTVAVTLVTGLLFGLLPSWHAARTGLYTTLRAHGEGRARGRLRSGLVVAEVGTALMLLVGAGLLLRSFERLSTVDMGFDAPERVLTFRVALPASRYAPDERLPFFGTLLERVRAIPGVTSAAAVNSLPLGGVNSDTDFAIEGEPPPPPGVIQAAWLRPVIDDYLGTIGLDVVEGRPIEASDDAAAPRVVVVNESMATRHLGGNAIGRRIAFGDPESSGWWTVVGVVRDVRHFAIRDGAGAGPDPTATVDAPAAYLSYRQTFDLFAPGTMSIAARVQGEPLTLAPAVRAALAGLDPRLAAASVQPLSTLVDDALARDRFVSWLMTAFAATALLLAALGIYGVVSYGVSRRMREMGIRRALGAETAEIGRLVVRGGLRLTAMGIGVGLVGSLLLARALGSLLYDVRPSDPLTLVGTALLLTTVALLASWLPTRRLGRVDPVSVLRAE